MNNINMINKLVSKHTKKKYIMFIFGVFLLSFGFNLFYAPYNIIMSGSAGLSLIFKEWINLSPSTFVAIVSITLLIFSYIYLGKDMTIKSALGSILYPIFLKITENIIINLDLILSSQLLIVIYGGVITGFATGLIFKSGFSIGGFNILYQISNKYLKIAIGKSSFAINAIVLLLSAYVFGITNAIYAIIALYISTFITDRVIIGVSSSKAFYILTDKDEEVSELVTKMLSHKLTMINTKGGYSNKRKKMIMCVIPTTEYFILREAVLEIDPHAFFLITDTYEVVGAV